MCGPRVSYDTLSRRKSVDYRNGTSADYTYSTRGDLLCHDWNLTGTAPASCNSGSPEIAYGFIYNAVGQLLTEAVSDSLLAWNSTADLTETYDVNGLNQYTQVARTPHGGAATTSPIAHSANGNVEIDDRGWSYVYSAENQLMTVHAPGAVLKGSYKYYGDGTRRFKDSAGAPIARFFYDGDQEIAEYDQTNTALIRRYVRLPGSVDEPFLMTDYTPNITNPGTCTISNYGTAAPCERWAHQNRLGSVVVVTSSTGAVVERHRYGPYGEVGGTTSGFPFRFTGQKLDPETGLYYYKARYYDPAFGRFLQTDPIGYADQMNLYAYVGNDPLNFVDPTGTEAACISIGVPCLPGGGTEEDAMRAAGAVATVALLFVPGPEDAILAVAGIRLLSTRVILATVRSEIKKGNRLMLYSGTPKPGAKQFSIKVKRVFWSKRINDKIIKEAIKQGKPIGDSYVDEAGELITAPKGSILERERGLLESEGWSFKKESGSWEPPSSDKILEFPCTKPNGTSCAY